MLFYLVVLAITASQAARSRLYVADYANAFSHDSPTPSEWSNYLAEHNLQLENVFGGTEFLNVRYESAWNRRLADFDHGYPDFDIFSSFNENPESDRIASRLGWVNSSETLNDALKIESYDAVKKRMLRLSSQWKTLFTALILGIILMPFWWSIRKRTDRVSG